MIYLKTKECLQLKKKDVFSLGNYYDGKNYNIIIAIVTNIAKVIR